MEWAEHNQGIFKEFWKVCFSSPCDTHGLTPICKYLTKLMRGIELGPMRWP